MDPLCTLWDCSLLVRATPGSGLFPSPVPFLLLSHASCFAKSSFWSSSKLFLASCGEAASWLVFAQSMSPQQLLWDGKQKSKDKMGVL